MEEEREALPENPQQNEIPEENLQNNMNTEENVIYNPPPSSTYIPVPSPVTYNMPPSNSENAYSTPITNNSANQNTASGGDTNTFWYDLSIFSWILLLWTTFNYFRNEHIDYIINAEDIEDVEEFINYYNFLLIPGKANLSLPLAITAVIGTIGFIIYFKNTTLNKNQSFINGMLGEMSKYHSIAFILVSCLFLTLDSASKKGTFVMGLILSLLSCGLLAFIYYQTDFSAEWYEMITLKKGIYSCLISLTWYMFFYSISGIGSSKDPSEDFYKGAGVALSILIGLGNLAFSFFFKDLLVAVINLLIYIEMAKYYYLSEEFLPNKADGAIDIIMVIGSCGVIFYLFFRERENLYRP